MNQTNMIKVNIILFLLIFSILFYNEINAEVVRINISKIDKSMNGEFIKIQAQVLRIENIGDISFIDFYDNTSIITGTIFENISLNISKKYEITGKVNVYNNKLGVIVEEVLY